MGAALVVGAGGRLGAALCRALRAAGEAHLATVGRGEDDEDPGRGAGQDVHAPAARRFGAAAGLGGHGRAQDGAVGPGRGFEALQLGVGRLQIVFDGSQPARRPDEARCPRSAYGALKAEAECRLLALGAGVAVVRISKLVDAELPLFCGWRRELRSGRPIAPFSDLRFSPVPLARAAEALLAVARARRGGVFQLSAEADLSYAEAARELARRLGAPLDLVRPVRASEAGLELAPPARHATLESHRLREELGVRLPSLREGLDALLG